MNYVVVVDGQYVRLVPQEEYLKQKAAQEKESFLEQLVQQYAPKESEFSNSTGVVLRWYEPTKEWIAIQL